MSIPAEMSDLKPETWVDLYGDFLFRYALVRVNNRDMSEDLVQETFLSALKASANFFGKSAVRTWLVSILKNKITDYYRKNMRAHVSFDNLTQDASDQSSDFQQGGKMKGMWTPGREPIDWGDNPELAVEKTEFFAVMNECLSLLPKQIAHVFSMREIDDMDSPSICKELNISPSNLWVMLHRARHHLRRCLEINWFSNPSKDK